jgi:hypothetical protein
MRLLLASVIFSQVLSPSTQLEAQPTRPEAPSILFPSLNPNSPRIQTAFNQMVTDYAVCHAYYDFAYSVTGTRSPSLSVKYLGAQANAAYEGHRLEVLANLQNGTFEKRREANRAEMQKVLDSRGFAQLYSIYDGFCEDLRDDPGGSFIRRLPPSVKPMKAASKGV